MVVVDEAFTGDCLVDTVSAEELKADFYLYAITLSFHEMQNTYSFVSFQLLLPLFSGCS